MIHTIIIHTFINWIWSKARWLIFIFLMYFGADNKHLIDHSVPTAQIGLSSLVSDIDEFLPSKISVSNYTAKIKVTSAQNPGAY